MKIYWTSQSNFRHLYKELYLRMKSKGHIKCEKEFKIFFSSKQESAESIITLNSKSIKKAFSTCRLNKNWEHTRTLQWKAGVKGWAKRGIPSRIPFFPLYLVNYWPIHKVLWVVHQFYIKSQFFPFATSQVLSTWYSLPLSFNILWRPSVQNTTNTEGSGTMHGAGDTVVCKEEWQLLSWWALGTSSGWGVPWGLGPVFKGRQ